MIWGNFNALSDPLKNDVLHEKRKNHQERNEILINKEKINDHLSSLTGYRVDVFEN